MTFTIITEDGTVMYREDIFATKAEADEFIAQYPKTPSGKPQHAVDTETANLISAEVRKAAERHQRALDVERREITSRMLHNAALFARDTAATQQLVADMERDGLL